MTDVLSSKAPKEFWATPGKFRAIVISDDCKSIIDCGEFYELITAKDEAIRQSIVHLGNGRVLDEHGDVVD